MRVISGQAKGHRLAAPPGFGVRPTADRIKGSIFSSISHLVQGSVFLDLFAGSGAMGIEALSRQARMVYFVENLPLHTGVIEANLGHIKKALLDGLYEVILGDAVSALDKFHTNGILFDIIFLDPPYGSQLLFDSIRRIYEYKLLSEEGLIIAEAPADLDFESELYINIIKTKKYAVTSVYYIDFEYIKGESDDINLSGEF